MIGEVVCEVIGDATTGVNTPIQTSANVRRPCVRTCKKATQNFKESVSVGTSHTAEQYSSEFKVSDQEGRRIRSNSRISRSSRAGAIMAVVSTEVPMDSAVVWQYGNI